MTSRPDRRTLLRSVAVGLIGLSGCAAFGDRTDPEAPRLVELTALNLDDAPHTFHVRIELDGETVYRESARIEAAGPDDPRGAVFAGYPSHPKPYVLSAWRDDRPEAEAKTVDFAEFDSKCLGVEVQYGTYGNEVENPRLAILRTTNCGSGR